MFRVLVLCQFYNLSNISAQLLAPRTHTQWSRQVDEGSAKTRAGCLESPVNPQNISASLA